MLPAITSLILLVPLAVVQYRIGSGRLLPQWRPTWALHLTMLLALTFIPWYVVSRALSAPVGLVPLAIAVLSGAYASGYSSAWRRWRTERNRSSEPAAP